MANAGRIISINLFEIWFQPALTKFARLADDCFSRIMIANLIINKINQERVKKSQRLLHIILQFIICVLFDTSHYVITTSRINSRWTGQSCMLVVGTMGQVCSLGMRNSIYSLHCIVNMGTKISHSLPCSSVLNPKRNICAGTDAVGGFGKEEAEIGSHVGVQNCAL